MDTLSFILWKSDLGKNEKKRARMVWFSVLKVYITKNRFFNVKVVLCKMGPVDVIHQSGKTQIKLNVGWSKGKSWNDWLLKGVIDDIYRMALHGLIVVHLRSVYGSIKCIFQLNKAKVFLCKVDRSNDLLLYKCIVEGCLYRLGWYISINDVWASFSDQELKYIPGGIV